MTTGKPQCCGSCYYWAALMVAAEGGAVEPSQFGYCRRFPLRLDKPWNEWCGEWRAADPEPEKPADPANAESDDDLRKRLWQTIGHATINESRIENGTGRVLDEIAGFYGITRR